ncbi:MAG: SDR family NAD(P)-dependent oxidoreductase, partial [Acidobacteriota bacterium]|nr:SDR family NAD(P)-dependent oxidoreductase [Acidobacteriota bacterium]
MPYVALVTGASSGIGEAVARRLAREPDVRLILVARREERLRALAEQFGGATVIAADLTDPQAASLIAETIEREHGALNLLVNNAGARWALDFSDGGWDNVAQHLRINFEAPVRLVEALLPLLRRTAAAGGPLAASSAHGGQRA